MRKGVLEINVYNKDPDHRPAEIYSLLRNFALFRYVLQHPMIIQASSEGPDQTVHMQTDLGIRCPHISKACFRMTTYVICGQRSLITGIIAYCRL